MSVEIARSGSLSEQRLSGIYWKTFVDFVNRENDGECSPGAGKNRTRKRQERIQKREGSFEYMELTTKDNISLQSESESCSSNENSMSDVSKDDRSTTMYAVLDMNRKKEIQINEEIAIFDGSPIRRHSFALTLTSIPASPKCSPIMHVGAVGKPECVPSPISGESGERTKTLHCIDKDDALFSDLDDTSYEDSYDYDSERPASTSPSPDTVPWKEQCLSIQQWMLPSLAGNIDDDEFVALPDSVPVQEYEYCHYVPTLEAIIEENEEGTECYEDLKQGFPKGNSIDNADIFESLSDDVGWQSANDLSQYSGQSQDDLYSITSTCGSLGSMRRISTMENLSFDDGLEDESDGSSDELDRVRADGLIHGRELGHEIRELMIEEDSPVHGKFDDDARELSTDLFPEETPEVQGEFLQDKDEDHAVLVENSLPLETLGVPRLESDASSVSTASPGNIESSQEVVPTSSVQSLLESDYESLSERGESLVEVVLDRGESVSSHPASSPSPFVTPRESMDDVRSEPILDTGDSDLKSDDYDEQRSKSELDMSDISPNLYFATRDIPKIVVMFAQEELAKERNRSIPRKDLHANGNAVHYRKRSSTYDVEGLHDSAYSSHEGIHRRIQELKSNDSRISTLSSSTPELSVMTEDALPYIPVSYASEAAAIKRKRKRRATISSAEASSRRNAIRALHSKNLISGTGLGNGFSSLRKKLSRKSIGNSIKRTQSEKQKLYYSSPDVSYPAPRIPSPRRKPKEEPELAPKVAGRRRGFRSVVSNILRRLSSRFTSQNHTSSNDVKSINDVIQEESPTKSNLLRIEEESNLTDSISILSSTRGSVESPSACNGDLPTRRVSSALATSGGDNYLEEFRERSYSVPVRPRSTPSPRKQESGESDVFNSTNSVAESPMDQTIYV